MFQQVTEVIMALSYQVETLQMVERQQVGGWVGLVVVQLRLEDGCRESSLWSSSCLPSAVGKAGKSLIRKWRSEQKVLELTDTRAGHKREACGELSLADVNDYLVQGKTLDGDCPRQLKGELET